jgi:perosamine synthetase
MYSRAKPYFSEEMRINIVKGVDDILCFGSLTQGKYVQKFENMFRDVIHTTYAVATNSCTSALEISIKSLGIENRKIIAPTNTFVATINSIITSGNIPIIVDINKNTLCISMKSIVENYDDDVAAIILVNIGGLITPEYHEISKFCKDNGLFLIEDAAHSLGSSLNGIMSGNLCDVGCFSFYPTKIITTCEGGMITTNNKYLAEKAILYRSHGGDGENFFYTSSNYRMTEISAVIGIEQLEHLDDFIFKRNYIADRYIDGLKDIDDIDLLPIYDGINSYWNFYFLTKSNNVRNELSVYLLSKGIQTGNAYYPSCHMQPVFKEHLTHYQNFDNAEDVLSRHISLPMYVELNRNDIVYITSNVRRFFNK